MAAFECARRVTDEACIDLGQRRRAEKPYRRSWPMCGDSWERVDEDAAMSLVGGANLCKTHRAGEVEVRAIVDANFSIQPSYFAGCAGRRPQARKHGPAYRPSRADAGVGPDASKGRRPAGGAIG
jgi:hypothetical protein